MTAPTTPSRRAASGRPLKSPLAVSANSGPRTSTPGQAPDAPVTQRPALSERGATLAEFEDHLRMVNSRDGRPYEEKTIQAYLAPARNLDKWLTARGTEGDFTVADAALLNRYFREYYLERGQGGTHTLQRNLIQLFNYLQRERDHPSPYDGDSLNRYAEVKGRPKTLGEEFVADLLEVTGGGKARDFETARDHAASCAARASDGRNCSAW
jgi:hypothetical protein